SSDLLIFKSGTSVQLGLLLAVPTVAFYKICGETLEKIARQFFMDLPFYTMPNLLAGREVIKEFIQTKFTLPNLYVACTELLDDPAQSGHLRAELAELRKATIEPDPIGESSRLICDLIDS
ncbi:MAG TPA: hypothetical protein ENN67_08025, partial [Firmicutes bacterium]|nr:hypothetical protein [Bacillota bacterium]